MESGHTLDPPLSVTMSTNDFSRTFALKSTRRLGYANGGILGKRWCWAWRFGC
jgi:hypothetical protein